MKTISVKPKANPVSTAMLVKSLNSKMANRAETPSDLKTSALKVTVGQPISNSAQAIQQNSQALLTKDTDMNSDTAIDSSMTTTNSGNTPRSTNPLLATISPLPAGLTIVCVRDPSLAPLVRNAFTCLALENSHKIGIPLPIVDKVISVDTGSPRELDRAKGFQTASIPEGSSSRHESKAISTSDRLDWCSDAGAVVFASIVPPDKCCVILQQQVDGPFTPAMAYGFFRFRLAAQQAGVFVILILVCPDESQSARLGKHSDELIEVARCEPDPGMNTAFSVDCHGLHSLNCFGVGKTMCCVSLSDGAIRYHYSPFIAADLKTRAMWILRGQGKTLDEIGTLCDLNKSNVSRQLQGLPAPRPTSMGDDWLTGYLDSLPAAKSIARPQSVID
jgi:hypothetical protein